MLDYWKSNMLCWTCWSGPVQKRWLMISWGRRSRGHKTGNHIWPGSVREWGGNCIRRWRKWWSCRWRRKQMYAPLVQYRRSRWTSWWWGKYRWRCRWQTHTDLSVRLVTSRGVYTLQTLSWRFTTDNTTWYKVSVVSLTEWPWRLFKDLQSIQRSPHCWNHLQTRNITGPSSWRSPVHCHYNSILYLLSYHLMFTTVEWTEFNFHSPCVRVSELLSVISFLIRQWTIVRPS